LKLFLSNCIFDLFIFLHAGVLTHMVLAAGNERSDLPALTPKKPHTLASATRNAGNFKLYELLIIFYLLFYFILFYYFNHAI